MGYRDIIEKLKRLINTHNQSHHNSPKLPIIQRDVKSIGRPITIESSSCLIPSRINILIDIRLNPNFSSILKILKALNLNQEDGRKLYLETWQRDRLFEYDEYTGIKVSDSINGKFVNITNKNGRLVLKNPKTAGVLCGA